MSAVPEHHVICDGCNQRIDWTTTLYRVWFTFEDGQDYHFHNYVCVRTWVDAKEKQRNDNLALAAKHAELHAALEAAAVNKDHWQTAHGLVESNDLETTQTHIAAIGAPANG